MGDDGPIVREVTATIYVIPTDAPEADGDVRSVAGPAQESARPAADGS